MIRACKESREEAVAVHILADSLVRVIGVSCASVGVGSGEDGDVMVDLDFTKEASYGVTGFGF